jgi:Flp pilus assembly protein TadD
LSAGRVNDASAVLQKALTLSPDYPSALYFLAKMEEQRGNHDQAVADLQRAVVSSGRTPKYLHALGMLYAEVGRRNEARELLEELQRQSRLRFVDSVYVANLQAKLADGPHQ